MPGVELDYRVRERTCAFAKLFLTRLSRNKFYDLGRPSERLLEIRLGQWYIRFEDANGWLPRAAL
jgi:hypothetical protein